MKQFLSTTILMISFIGILTAEDSNNQTCSSSKECMSEKCDMKNSKQKCNNPNCKECSKMMNDKMMNDKENCEAKHKNYSKANKQPVEGSSSQ